jgi:ubiquinone/menaquinone biosynthesis C-methylase UbiE
MSNSIFKPSAKAKQEFYSQPDVATHYDELRFGGASGAWVDQREIEMVQSLVPSFRRALDLGCGTGRLTRVLAACGETIGLDYSAAMLVQARQKAQTAFTQGDAFHLPFADSSFDTVVALRIVFHFAEIDSFLKNVQRVLAPRGTAVFDTYQWTPRAWRPLDSKRWGGGVYAHSIHQIEQAATSLNLRIVDRKYCFLFSPYIYRRLPLALVHALEHMETRVPDRYRARVFWKLVRQEKL